MAVAVAEGLTNRQAAEQLLLSRHTVPGRADPPRRPGAGPGPDHVIEGCAAAGPVPTLVRTADPTGGSG